MHLFGDDQGAYMANPHNIDDMKALIVKRGGIARGNRYGVQITNPIRVKNQMDSGLDYLSNNITKEGIDTSFIGNGRDVFILCTAVSLPGKLINTTEATHNHNMSKKPYSMTTDQVTMTFLLTNDYYMKKYFDFWMELIVDSSGNHYKTAYKSEYSRDVEIHALNTKNENIGYGVKLEHAYPIQISQVELGESQEGLMQVTVTWEYDNWKITHMKQGFGGSDEKLLSELDVIKRNMALNQMDNGLDYLNNVKQPRSTSERQTSTIVKEEVRGPWTKKPGPWNNFLR